MADEKLGVGHIKLHGLACTSSSFKQTTGGVVARRLPADTSLNFTMQFKAREMAERRITVELKVVLNHDDDAGQPYDAEVTYVGDFEFGDLPEGLTMESFVERNAPAILFPYVRETITSLTGRGAAGPVTMPPVNVAALIERAKEPAAR